MWGHGMNRVGSGECMPACGLPQRCPVQDPRCSKACSREWTPRRGGPGPRRGLCKQRGVMKEK
eukprot:3724335-Amphidinium_carterae.1